MVVLSEPVEKHDRCVYEMGAESVSHEQRAALLSKVLGRTIKYEQQSIEDSYKAATGAGMPHAFVYTLLTYSRGEICRGTTPQLALILGRPLGTLEQWLKQNVKKLQ